MIDGPSHEVQSYLPNLLSTSGGGTIDARLDYTHFSEDGGDATVLGFNLHGQYISPGGAGGYVALPFAYVSENDESESGLGNLEVGGLYAMRSSPTLDVLLRGGIALDTASDEGSIFVPVSQISPRLTDAYTTGFQTTWARAQVQLRHASGQLRLGAAAGFDIPVDGAAAESDSFDGLFNAAVSLGFDTPSIGIGLGLSFIHALTDGDSEDDTISSFNATIDFPVGARSRLFGALGVPDLDNVSDNGADLFAIGVGLRMGI